MNQKTAGVISEAQFSIANYQRPGPAAQNIMSVQTSLFNYRRETKGLLCLQCVLTECDESDPLCLYKTAKDRKTYYREHYQANREKKIAATKERNAANPQYRLYQIEYQREYRRQGRDK